MEATGTELGGLGGSREVAWAEVWVYSRRMISPWKVSARKRHDWHTGFRDHHPHCGGGYMHLHVWLQTHIMVWDVIIGRNWVMGVQISLHIIIFFFVVSCESVIISKRKSLKASSWFQGGECMEGRFCNKYDQSHCWGLERQRQKEDEGLQMYFKSRIGLLNRWDVTERRMGQRGRGDDNSDGRGFSNLVDGGNPL